MRDMYGYNGHRGDAVIDVVKPGSGFTGGLEFSSLTYMVLKEEEIEGKWIKREVDLLHRITGYAPKGCITAVMGPSGAGKSTFLDGLAGRIASGSLKGRVSLDGTEMSPSLIKRTSAYIMQDDRLFPMLTVYETLMFAADFRLGGISVADKKQRVERLIEQLGLSSSRNTYIGDEGTRGVSGGERRRVSIGVDIIHGPPVLFLDEPTSGLDSTSAHSVIERVHDIARSGSTVILTIHQPSHRILMLLDHLIVLARGKLMFQGSPKDVTRHLSRMGRKVPKGENSIEYLLDVIQQYDQSELGVGVLADFAITGMKPPQISDEEMFSESLVTVTPTHTQASQKQHKKGSHRSNKEVNTNAKRLPLTTGSDVHRLLSGYDHSVRSTWSSSMSWSVTQSVVMETLRFTPSRHQTDRKLQRPAVNLSPGYAYSSDVLPRTPTPQSSDYTVVENDYMTPGVGAASLNLRLLGPKFANSFFSEILIHMRRNFTNIYRTPELFLSRQMVLTAMGVMMATMFINPKNDMQGITDRLSFFIFTVCLFFFSSNDAVPAFIQERFIFIRETSHNCYRASAYVISGLITYLPFLAIQAATYALIVWFALDLSGSIFGFLYFLTVLYVSLLATNSFVMFISSVVPNYILGYAAVIAFTALFFLFCGYFLNSQSIPMPWRWMNKISTMTYPYEGLLMNQYQTSTVFAQNSGVNVTGYNILEGLHISTDESKWKKALILLGWAVFYRVLFYVVLRFASKNQRS
ncbi:hypothetical protein Syun_004373 [Stephania yunnanensis]|uniref:ABC transporter G family member STR2 n=1 Tax=Stephania yunnanensis TaxID=152371 RepID=A0AAP0L3C3_9MAGN